MNKFEVIKWLQNLKKDIGQSQHQDLWHYAEVLDEVISAIEVSEDTISRANAIKAVKNVSENYTGKGKRDYHPHIDFIVDALEYVAPSVAPQPKEGKWIVDISNYESICPICGASEEEFIYGTEMWYGLGESKFCPNCGAKMKGAENE